MTVAVVWSTVQLGTVAKQLLTNDLRRDGLPQISQGPSWFLAGPLPYTSLPEDQTKTRWFEGQSEDPHLLSSRKPKRERHTEREREDNCPKTGSHRFENQIVRCSSDDLLE